MTELIGKFHPLLVHLPIGFLLIAVVFIWIKESSRVVKISIGLGAIAAIASVITGLLLADNEGYDGEVQLHKWFGIVLTTVSATMWFLPEKFWKAGSAVMTMLLLLTGHYGGTLTHGPLIAVAEVGELDVVSLDMNKAIFYDDAVKPILEARCVSCHGEDKQKGGLRLDNKQAIDKGGKNGKVIVPGNPGESEIVTRLELPLDDEDHMPPREKKQLSDHEKKLISLWVASGADFSKRISESLSTEQISELTKKNDEIALPEVAPADPAIVKKLIESNVAITPVASGSNLLQVNFVSAPNEAAKLLEELKPIAMNVLSLKLNGTKIERCDLSAYKNLRELNLAGTQVTTIDGILGCTELRSLNISGTGITDVSKLSSLKQLKYLNVFNTRIQNISLPGIEIEKGIYDVPTLQSDTTVVKPKE